MRYGNVYDIIRLALDLSNSYTGLTLKELQDDFGVSRRTIIRMKQVLEDIFPGSVVEVENPGSREKKWRLLKTPLSNMITFTAEEFAALEKCKSILKNNNIIADGGAIDGLISKLNTLTNKKASKVDIEALLEAEGYAIRQHPHYKISLETLNVVSECLKAYKYIEFEFPSSKGGERTIKVQPYGIIYGETTYLLAYNEQYEELRYYKFNKMINPRCLDEYFDKDENFDIKKYLANSFGLFQEEPMNVKLQFVPDVAKDVLEYHFHPSQKIKQNKDGSVTVTFKASGDYEICWHLFRWGKKVKILEPQKLIDTYKQLLQEAIETTN